ncbi:hypothetical protein Mal64_11690 [Pseudobythopirellula maris]|uniref:DUF304 domain-containing protein n=1 Tax=Pseudobythopirellula maris TaxID=2527991 RepID=A0A5C5ZTE7_9BACT|nr:hypothetical protein [Pseudobythopirellula maris]TWT90772.1 hypothetical protein Mal64_11690 [Pseudobythopirellula maris]
MDLPTTLDIRDLPEQLRNLVAKEIDRDEILGWIGQPSPRAMSRRATPLFMFGCVWTAFAVFWVCGAAEFELPDWDEGFDFFPLFGLPFVVIGIGMLSSPIWFRRSAKQTAYVLTDRRAVLFVKELTGIRVRSFKPKQLQNLERRQRADGSGDLIFYRDIGRDNDGDRTTSEVGFLAIDDVKGVQDLVEAVVAKHSADDSA